MFEYSLVQNDQGDVLLGKDRVELLFVSSNNRGCGAVIFDYSLVQYEPNAVLLGRDRVVT